MCLSKNRIIIIDIIVFVKNNSPIKLNKFFKNKHDIDKCNFESEKTSSVESCSCKKAKPSETCKYSRRQSIQILFDRQNHLN